MKGIRISTERPRGWAEVLPPGEKPFEFLFLPVLSALPPMYWYLGTHSGYDYFEAVEAFGEDYIESLYVDEITQACIRDNVQIGVVLLRPAFLPKFAPFIYTDHNYIIAR